ncbi:hypothetical protein ACFWQL_09815 [Amycolatopsis thermoflava]
MTGTAQAHPPLLRELAGRKLGRGPELAEWLHSVLLDKAAIAGWSARRS